MNLDLDPIVDSSNYVKNMLSKYTQPNLLPESLLDADKALAPTKENTKCTPDEKVQVEQEKDEDYLPRFAQSTPLSDDTISMSEEFIYEDRNSIILDEAFTRDMSSKVDLSKIFAKYLQPKELEPTRNLQKAEKKEAQVTRYTESPPGKFTRGGPESFSLSKEFNIMPYVSTPSKNNKNGNCDVDISQRCSTIEKSSFISKYLDKSQHLTPNVKEKKEKNLSPRSVDWSVLGSAIKRANPSLMRESKTIKKDQWWLTEEKEAKSSNFVKSVFSEKQNGNENEVQSNKLNQTSYSSLSYNQKDSFNKKPCQVKDDSLWSVSKIAQDVLRNNLGKFIHLSKFIK